MTRAVQFEILLAGIRHPTTGAPLSGGKVQFKAAGTDTSKAAYTDEAKATTTYQTTLDAAGRAMVYGDGVYKLKVLDASDVLLYTWDNVKVQFYSTKVRSIIASGALSVDDDFILVDTSAGNITLSLPAASLWSHPITVKKTSSDANTITLDPSGTELIDGGATLAFSFPGYAFTVVSDGSNLYGATPNPSYLPLSGGRMAGAVEFGSANAVIKALSDGSLSLEAKEDYAFLSSKLAAHLAGNAYWDGAFWQRYDTASPATVLATGPTQTAYILTAAAGANPITWSGPYAVKYGDYPFFHGRVNANGTAGRLPSGWTCAKLGTGSYRITHGLGNTNYTPVVTAELFSITYNRTTTTFDVNTYNSAMGLVDAPVFFSLFTD